MLIKDSFSTIHIYKTPVLSIAFDETVIVLAKRERWQFFVN